MRRSCATLIVAIVAFAAAFAVDGAIGGSGFRADALPNAVVVSSDVGQRGSYRVPRGMLAETATGHHDRPRLRVVVRRVDATSEGVPRIASVIAAAARDSVRPERPVVTLRASPPPGALSTSRGRGHASAPTSGQPPIATYDRLVWSDEFAGAAGSAPNPAAWAPDVGAWGGGDGQLQTYTPNPENLSLDGSGDLAITAVKQTAPAPNGPTPVYTSARIETAGLFSFTYGRVEARIKVPAGRGLWPAFWLLGDDVDSVGWPASGEIDVMEMIGQDPSAVYGTLHGPVSGSTTSFQVQARAVSARSFANAFHTFGVIWQPGRITWTLDGKAYASATPHDVGPGDRWVFDAQPFHLILDLAVGGHWPGAPNSATAFPATMLVDWVHVYQ